MVLRRLPSVSIELHGLFGFVPPPLGSVFSYSEQIIESDQCKITDCLVKWCRERQGGKRREILGDVRLDGQLLLSGRIFFCPSIEHLLEVWEKICRSERFRWVHLVLQGDRLAHGRES